MNFLLVFVLIILSNVVLISLLGEMFTLFDDKTIDNLSVQFLGLYLSVNLIFASFIYSVLYAI